MSKELIQLQGKYQILDDMYMKLKKKNEELRQGIINDRNDIVLVPKEIYSKFDALKASHENLLEYLELYHLAAYQGWLEKETGKI